MLKLMSYLLVLEVDRASDAIAEKGDSGGQEQERGKNVSGNGPAYGEGKDGQRQEKNGQRIVEARQFLGLRLASIRTKERLRDADEQVPSAARGETGHLNKPQDGQHPRLLKCRREENEQNDSRLIGFNIRHRILAHGEHLRHK